MSLADTQEFLRYREDVRAGRSVQALESLNRNWETSLSECVGSDTGLQSLLATLPVWLAEGFLRGPCTVLASLRELPTGGGVLSTLAQRCRVMAGELHAYESVEWRLLAGIELRCQLVQWVHGQGAAADPDQIEEELGTFLTTLQTLGHTSEWCGRGISFSMNTPAVFRRLDRIWPRVAAVLRDFADKPEHCPLGWLDPGLGLLMRLLESARQPEAFDPTEDNPRSTAVWIPLAVNDPEWISPHRTGWRARFEVRRLQGKGNGSLVPNIHHSSHILPDAPFQRSLANAWAVVLQHASEEHWREADYEWRLKLHDPTGEASISRSEQSPLGKVHGRLRTYAFMPFAGESGTLAIACSLRAAAAGEDLDRYIITSAWFGETPDPVANPRLSPVDGVDLKVLSGLQDPEFKSSDQWLLANVQTHDLAIEPPPLTAETFEDAYSQFTADGTQTRAYRAHCVKAREEHFTKYSFGLDAYHPPRIERLVKVFGSKAEWQLLKPEDQQAVLSGRVWRDEAWGKRIRLRADSGMGKTTLLQWCAGEIARDEQSWWMVPIVLNDLAEYFGSISVKALCELLAERDDFKSMIYPTDSKRRNEWLEQRFKNNEVVLLLDAFDQMAVNRERMLKVLRSSLPKCRVLLTGRPAEIEGADDSETDWVDLALQPFNEQQARDYLGDRALADRLFKLLDVKDAVGKRLPGGVLTVPLLLYLLRGFAADNSATFLDGIAQGGKHAGRPQLYGLLLASDKGLVGKGFQTLTENEKSIWGTAEDANDALARLAWCHLTQPSTTLDFELSLDRRHFSQVFDTWRKRYSHHSDVRLKEALAQLNLLTKFSLCEEFQQTAEQWQWRHRSFLEYFAGRFLVQLCSSGDAAERNEAHEWLRRIHEEVGTGRDLRQDADWLLRYSLGYASAKAVVRASSERDRLALELIALGNPWVVYHSLQDDQVQFDDSVTQLTRWLVHRDDNLRRDYRAAWPGRGNKPSDADSSIENQVDLTRIWNVATRDSACLIPAAEIVHGFDADESDPAGWLSKVSITFEQDRQVVVSPIWKEFQRQFVEIPRQRFDAKRFHPKVDFAGLGVGNPQAIPIGVDRRLEMADFLVTNELWELFEPGHRRWRTQINAEDKSPVVNVNWYMAQAFCAWLTAQDDQWEYGLPTEWEWEAVVRWPQTRRGPHVTTTYWWGDEPQWQSDDGTRFWLMNCYDAKIGRTTTREEAIQRHKDAGLWHPSKPAGTGDEKPGILDLHGNVWVWCTSEYTSGGSPLRVLRGGSWRNLDVFDAEASSRCRDRAALRFHSIGLRVVRRDRVSPAVLNHDL